MRLVIPSLSATGRMPRRISCCPQYGFFPPLLGLANTQCCASLSEARFHKSVKSGRGALRAFDRAVLKVGAGGCGGCGPTAAPPPNGMWNESFFFFIPCYF